MAPGLLPDHIGPLVDQLRKSDHQAVSLPDVAALTEILMRSLESYFKSIDLTIYQECQALADYIDDARQEISSLSPDHSDEAKIPRAGLELEAIVQQTESATNSIMESSERIMEADPSDMEAYTTTVNDAVMQIFEACSFQDITGQRISKVVSTLEHVENRVGRLINILGVIEGAGKKASATEQDDEEDENKALLNGPALDGEGIDQTEIDALLNGTIDDDVDFEIDDNPAPKDDVIAEEVETPKTSETPEVPEAPETVASPDSDVATSEDIDFMFDGSSEQSSEDPITEGEPIVTSEEPTPVAEEAETATATEAPPAPESSPEPNLIEQAKQRKAEAQEARKAQVKPAKPVIYEEDAKAGLNPKTTENTTQSDIDALFS